MSNPFISQPVNTTPQPTFAPSQPIAAPVAQAAPPVQHQYQAPAPVQGPSGLDDPQLYSGHNTPLLPNTLDGRWDLQILSVSGAKGYDSGYAVHITFKVHTSTNAAIKPGETYRIFYKFNYVNMDPVEGKQGTVHAGLLGKFVAALFKREYTDPSFAKTAALHQICTNAGGGRDARGNVWALSNGHDFGAAPGFVTLMGELRDREVTDAATRAVSKSRLRSDIWLAAPTA